MFAQLLAIVFFTTLVCSSVGAGLCCKNVTAAAKEGVDSGAISSVSITLSDDISMNFFVDKAQAGDAPYMEFSFNGNTARDDEPREEGEFYVFSYRGITPQHLNDTVTATAYTGDGTNIGSGEKSVRDYCGGLLSNDALHYGYDDVKYEAMTTLVADLLGYGAAAQLYKNEATDDLADSILAEYPSVSGSEFRALGQEDNILSFEGTADAAVMPVSATLRFDYNVELLFRYEVDATIAEGLSVAVEKNGAPTEAYTVEKDGAGDTVVYTVACNGLRAMEFDVPVSVRFLNGGEPIGLQTTYSVNSYIYEKQNDVETEGLQALVRATYLYGESAKHFYELPDISFDDGALKDNILEAEAAETDGGNLTVATNYRFSVDLSGGLALANINNTDGLNSLIFNFTSDKTAIVEVQARVSTFSLDHELENFSQAYTVSNNGKEVDVSGIDVPERGSGDLAYGTSADRVHGNYFTMVTIPLYVPVYKGNNSLMFTRAVYGLNFDYINIRTSANIEWEEHYPEDFENGTIEVVGIPNDTRTGSIRIEGANGESISGTLPEYSYGCYDAVEEGGSLLHYLTVGNKRVDVTDYYAGEMYTLTVDMGDGTVENKSLSVGDTYRFPAGYIGYIAEGAADGVVATSYVMPAENVKIKLLKTPVYATDDSTAPGKLDYGNSTLNTYGTDPSFTQRTYTYIGEEYARLLTISRVSTSSSDATGYGANFRLLTKYARAPGKTYNLSYTFKNFSEETICFDFYLRTKGAETVASVPLPEGSRITLHPGETFTYTLDWENARSDDDPNLLTYYKFLDPETHEALSGDVDIRLAVSAYVNGVS